MIDAGDVYLSDLGGEVRERALVVSTSRFHRLSGRAIVCPEQMAVPPEVPPWWIPISGTVFAVDQLLTVPVGRLLEPIERVGSSDLARVRRALVAIT